jgi:vanillate O-demethylase ferredoxin subunit
VVFHFDCEHAGRPLDVSAFLKDSGPDDHIYCCGPASLMDAVRTHASAWPSANVHFEWFTSDASIVDTDFDIVLKKRGRRLTVSAGKRIIEVLEENDVIVPSVCRNGICGTCETDVLEGIPDHRDQVLTDDERASNSTMMVCISRSKSEYLVLDL